MRRSKAYRNSVEKIEATKLYSIDEAVKLAKSTSTVKFDAAMDIAYKLNLDTTQADQQLRSSIVLPNGTGKTSKVLVFAKGDAAKAAEAAGADYVGEAELADKIKKENWFDFDVVIATPDMMPVIGKIGQILGPKGLMPNPKVGTVTPNPEKAIEDIKAGKIIYRTDKNANVHSIVGKVSFSETNLVENIKALHAEILRVRPASAKGVYISNISLTTTMGPGIKIDPDSLV